LFAVAGLDFVFPENALIRGCLFHLHLTRIKLYFCSLVGTGSRVDSDFAKQDWTRIQRNQSPLIKDGTVQDFSRNQLGPSYMCLRCVEVTIRHLLKITPNVGFALARFSFLHSLFQQC